MAVAEAEAGTRGVAVVGGAGGALGRAVVARLLGDGFRVVGLARGVAVGAVPDGAERLVLDLGDADAVAALPERIAGIGPWRALVVASGGFAAGAAHRVGEAGMRDQLELNLLGPWRLCRAAARAMQERGEGGRIVVTLSRASVHADPGQAAYQVSKAGAARLVEVMAQELVEDAIAVNGVLPSTMDTAANRSAMPHAEHRRWVPVERVAEVVGWLCTEAPVELSGALMPVYGRA